MSYSGAAKAQEARESLGKALEALQQDPNIPPDVMAVAQNIAQCIGSLFEAERASSEPDGKACIKSALGSLSQTLALLQDVGQHKGIEVATEVIAKAMSILYPLTAVPSKVPPAQSQPAPAAAIPQQPAMPADPVGPTAVAPAHPAPQQAPPSTAPVAGLTPSMRPPPAPVPSGPRKPVEVNIGAATESNFYVGFSGEIADGGVFLSTYDMLGKGASVHALVTLPGNFQFECDGWVRFVRDPMDFNSDSEPGIGIQFENLGAEARELILRFVRKRAPLFYED